MFFVDDLRYALRSLARTKTTTAVLLLSLAVGTGANAALYRVIHALLFEAPAAVADPSRLAHVFTSQFNGSVRGRTSYPDYLSVKMSNPAFESVAAFDDSAFETITFGTVRQRVRVVAASPEFFNTLGMTPHAGQLLGGAVAGSSKPSAVISYSMWMTIGQPSDVIGRDILIGPREYTVGGIAPPRFNGLQLGRPCDVWIPLSPQNTDDRGDRRLSLIGRLKPAADLDDVQRGLEALSHDLAQRYPDTNRGTRTSGDEPRQLTITRYTRMEAAEREQLVLIGVAVMGATTLLLVSACVNAATLFLSRSAARRRELAVKLALGASRQLLARQALVEALALALAGATFGLLLAHWTGGALPAFFAPEEADLIDTHLGIGIVLTTIALSAVAGFVFAIGPARHATQTLDVEVLRADAGAVSARGGTPLRLVVVTGQVALSTVILIAAGLLVRSLTVALEGDLGSGSRGIATTFLRMPGDAQEDVLRGIRFQSDALATVRKIPGVESVGWIEGLPVSRNRTMPLRLQAGAGSTETVEVDVNVASVGYFNTLRIPVIDGRAFTAEDRALSKPVVIINDILAFRSFGARAVGQRITAEDGITYEIVGVVRSGKYRTFQEAPEPMVYFVVTQWQKGYLQLVVRTSGDAKALLPVLENRLRSIDGEVDIRSTKTFDDHLAQALTLDRLTTTVVAACGLATLILATIGVYGVIGDGVRRRTPEIGLRLALGANSLQVVRLVFSEGLHLTTVGAGFGVIAALVLARVVRVFVHGLPAVDATSLAVAPLALLLVVIGAAALPTRRALRISPTIALRAE
jgi:putative ABC transport system permease protein